MTSQKKICASWAYLTTFIKEFPGSHATANINNYYTQIMTQTNMNYEVKSTMYFYKACSKSICSSESLSISATCDDPFEGSDTGCFCLGTGGG